MGLSLPLTFSCCTGQRLGRPFPVGWVGLRAQAFGPRAHPPCVDQAWDPPGKSSCLWCPAWELIERSGRGGVLWGQGRAAPESHGHLHPSTCPLLAVHARDPAQRRGWGVSVHPPTPLCTDPSLPGQLGVPCYRLLSSLVRLVQPVPGSRLEQPLPGLGGWRCPLGAGWPPASRHSLLWAPPSCPYSRVLHNRPQRHRGCVLCARPCP